MDQAQKTRVERLPRGVAGTGVTVRKVINTILRTEQHPIVYAQARELVRTFPPRDKRAEVQGIYNLVRRVIRYTDDPLWADSLVEPQFILERWHIERRPVAADCVSQTILVAVLARNLGIPVRLRVIGERWPRRSFYHIHPELHVDGRWVAADVTATTASSRKIRQAARLGFRAPAELERIYDIK